MNERLRITFLQTHPVQYMAPWFRDIAAHRDDIDLHVLYASLPTPAQQGVGFAAAFAWDSPLLEGYAHTVLLPPAEDRCFDSDDLHGVVVPDVERAIVATNPDVVVVPGWHSMFYLEAIEACRKVARPILYRGDSSFVAAPAGVRRLAWTVRTRRRLRLFDGYLSVGTRVREYLQHFAVPDPLIFDSPAVVDNARFVAASRAMRDGEGRAALRAQLGAGAEDYLILFAGKFTVRKRPADVLTAASRLGPDVVVAMAGGGSLEAELRATAARLGVRVTWCGFLNETALERTLVAADVVAVPSRWETWGLIVNEALAAGTPAVVSSAVAAEADLIGPASGATHRPADVEDLVHALAEVRAALRTGAIGPTGCQRALAGHTFARASDGLAAGARRLVARKRLTIDANPGRPRIMAAFGQMVLVSGLERMSLEVLRAMREQGAAIHCIVNSWGSSRVVDRVDAIPASWTTGYYWYRLGKQLRTWPQALWDIVMTSGGLVRDAIRFRPTHVFASDFGAVLRSSLGLTVVRLFGVRSVLRLGTPPEPGRLNHIVWKWIVDRCVDEFVANSAFIHGELLRHGIASGKARIIRNTVPYRAQPWTPSSRTLDRIIYVGQIIPPKGVHVLLDAVALLAMKGVDVSLDVVGDLEAWEPPGWEGYRASIQRRADAPELRSRVRLLGTREDVPALMAQAALHCLPSLPAGREGFAVVTLEAKRAGIPSVVTPSGALPETVTHRVSGWVCRDGSAEAVAEGLEYFLAQPAVREAAGAAASQEGAAYSYDRFVAAWGDVFAIPPIPRFDAAGTV